jgi:F0F1-type ATP synthase membrane subunit b/b'
MQKGQEDMAAQKDRIMKEIRSEITELSVGLTEKLLRREFDESSRARLLAEALDELDAMSKN